MPMPEAMPAAMPEAAIPDAMPGAIPEAIPEPNTPETPAREVQPRIPSDEEAGWLLTPQQLPYQQGRLAGGLESGGTIKQITTSTGTNHWIETRKCGGARCTHRRCQRTDWLDWLCHPSDWNRKQTCQLPGR